MAIARDPHANYANSASHLQTLPSIKNGPLIPFISTLTMVLKETTRFMALLQMEIPSMSHVPVIVLVYPHEAALGVLPGDMQHAFQVSNGLGSTNGTSSSPPRTHKRVMVWCSYETTKKKVPWDRQKTTHQQCPQSFSLVHIVGKPLVPTSSADLYQVTNTQHANIHNTSRQAGRQAGKQPLPGLEISGKHTTNVGERAANGSH